MAIRHHYLSEFCEKYRLSNRECKQRALIVIIFLLSCRYTVGHAEF